MTMAKIKEKARVRAREKARAKRRNKTYRKEDMGEQYWHISATGERRFMVSVFCPDL
jgi:hypothetical protein